MAALSLLFADPAAAQDIERAVSALAAAWGEEDTGALQAMLASSVHLDLGGEDHLGVSPRQVAASLDRLFQGFEPMEPEVSRQGHLEEPGARGFAELRWSPRAPGASAPTPHLLFVGLRRLPEGWRITEIRILR